jgi:hypothetical protein
MDNDTLKSRGIYFIGLGILLVGIAAIVWSCTKIAETIYFRKFMASGTWPTSSTISGENPHEITEQDISIISNTALFPMSGAGGHKVIALDPKEKK